MNADVTELARRVARLCQELLELATSGEWEQFEKKLQERDTWMSALFSGPNGNTPVIPEWLDTLKEIHTANEQLLKLSIEQRNAIAKELSSLKKAQKAQTAYSAVSGEE